MKIGYIQIYMYSKYPIFFLIGAISFWKVCKIYNISIIPKK